MDDDFYKIQDDPRAWFIALDLTDARHSQWEAIDHFGPFDDVYHLAAVNGTKLFCTRRRRM